MTNHWIDLKNSDCILIMGSNAAENHPISMKYVTEAQSRGGKLISVDPRFTRTSAKADIYAPLRSGTDIAFLGGMIKYIIDNKLYNEEDVVGYSDAAFLVGDGFDFKDGLFSGFDAGKQAELVSLTRIILPAQVFLMLGAMLSGTLQARNSRSDTLRPSSRWQMFRAANSAGAPATVRLLPSVPDQSSIHHSGQGGTPSACMSRIV